MHPILGLSGDAQLLMEIKQTLQKRPHSHCMVITTVHFSAPSQNIYTSVLSIQRPCPEKKINYMK